jgi:outer membrane autotransporter protein
VSELLPMSGGGGVNALASVIETVNTAFLTNTSAFISAPGGVTPDQQGGGEWVRGIGGWVETKATGVFSGSLSSPRFGIFLPGLGTSTCQTTVHQDYGGFQAGHDIAVLNDSTLGANWHFGVTGGYLESYAKDITPFGGSDSPAGSLTANFQVPFAGVYAAFTQGNFYADGQARVNYYQSEVNDPVANRVFNQRLDAKGYSLTGNVGYRFDLPEQWFIEPSIGGFLSHVSVDPFQTSGTQVFLTGLALPGTVQILALPGTVQINDFDSELGRASMRVGTTVSSSDGTLVAQPFFAASVYHEFAGDVTTSIKAGVPGL